MNVYPLWLFLLALTVRLFPHFPSIFLTNELASTFIKNIYFPQDVGQRILDGRNVHPLQQPQRMSRPTKQVIRLVCPLMEWTVLWFSGPTFKNGVLLLGYEVEEKAWLPTLNQPFQSESASITCVEWSVWRFRQDTAKITTTFQPCRPRLLFRSRLLQTRDVWGSYTPRIIRKEFT